MTTILDVVVKVCTKSFTNSQSLLRHSMSHTGNKPFSCDVCDRSFSQASTLKRHQHIHKSTLTPRKRGRKPVQSHSFLLSLFLRVQFQNLLYEIKIIEIVIWSYHK